MSPSCVCGLWEKEAEVWLVLLHEYREIEYCWGVWLSFGQGGDE
jgi:hypothetical protein